MITARAVTGRGTGAGGGASCAGAERAGEGARSGRVDAFSLCEAAASLNAVDRYISYLRHKLGEPTLIRTVRGVGFVLER